MAMPFTPNLELSLSFARNTLQQSFFVWWHFFLFS